MPDMVRRQLISMNMYATKNLKFPVGCAIPISKGVNYDKYLIVIFDALACLEHL
jgi:hypothetical protein